MKSNSSASSEKVIDFNPLTPPFIDKKVVYAVTHLQGVGGEGLTPSIHRLAMRYWRGLRRANLLTLRENKFVSFPFLVLQLHNFILAPRKVI